MTWAPQPRSSRTTRPVSLPGKRFTSTAVTTSWIKCRWRGDANKRSRHPRPLRALSQPQPDADPAGARKQEIDPKENAEHIEARHRPARENDEAENQGDYAGKHDPDPRHLRLHAEGENDPHDTRGNKGCAQQQSQHYR